MLNAKNPVLLPKIASFSIVSVKKIKYPVTHFITPKEGVLLVTKKILRY